MSTPFVELLAAAVPTSHLVLAHKDHGCSPMRSAVQGNKTGNLRLLMLKGVPLCPQDLPLSYAKEGDRLELRRSLLVWLENELHVRYIWDSLVLGSGLSRHHPLPDENQLSKLRGMRNTEVRMRLAGYIGVRIGAEMGRIRRAHAALREGATDESSR